MKFCVIGLGRFGQQVVKTLHENGAEVLAVDTLQSNIAAIKNYTAQAICVTVHDEPTLEAIGVDEMDVARGRISWISPLARALIKARNGDSVRFQSPLGWREIDILDVRYETIE